jgi:hypothetical protein
MRGRLAAPLLAVALLTACTAGPGQGPDDGPASASGTGTAAPTADATPSTTPDGAGGATPSTDGESKTPSTDGESKTGGTDGESKTPSTDGKSKTGGKGTEPEGAGSGAPDGRSGGQSGAEGSEIAPPAPGRSSGDNLGDSAVPAAGRLTRDQRTGTADGLVAGFPDDVVLVPAGTAVASSSVTGTDGRYQVTLDAKVDGGCDAVVLDYRSWFTSGGFTETGSTARPGHTTVDLARADGTVQLGTTRTRSGCGVIVFAALSAK